jgi:hypothetical protein
MGHPSLTACCGAIGGPSVKGRVSTRRIRADDTTQSRQFIGATGVNLNYTVAFVTLCVQETLIKVINK